MNGDLYFDDKKYISVKRAAEISGYALDYIGQLCRSKKLESRMVGRSWFVSEISLFEYFDKQQHEINANSSSRDDNNKVIGGSGEFVYVEDKRPLFPDVSEKVATPIIDTENGVGETKKDIPWLVDKSPLHKKNAGHNFRLMLRAGAMMAVLVLIAGALENFSFTKESYKNISSLPANFLKEIVSQSGSEKSVDFKGRYENKVLALIEKTPLYFEAGLRSSVDRVASAYHSFASGFDIADNNFNFSAFKKNASSFLNKAKLALGGHSGLKYFSAATEVSFKEKSLSSINDFSLKIYNGTNNLFSGVKNYFGGFFDGRSELADKEIVPIKESSSGKSSSSVSSAKATLATSYPNSSESAAYNPQPTTYPPATPERSDGGRGNLIQPDITRKEVLDLIKQYDDNSKALIYAANAANAANGENSLTISQSISGLEKRISNLQYINSRQLDKPASVLSRSDADIKNISGASVADSTITSSSFSGTTGTFSGNLTVGSQLTVSGTATSTIAGDASFDSGTLYIDSINNRVGIGTTSPYAKLSVVGPVAAEYFHATSTTATSTFSGQTVAGFAPTLAHSFGSWSVGASGANPLGASLIINPSSAVSDSNLLSLSVNGSAKFLVDAEGDIFANAVTVVGGTTLSTTTASTFTVENNTYLGDATTTDITYFNSRIADSLIPTADNLLDLGDSTNWLRWRTGYFGTSVGVGGTATSTGTQLTTSGAYLINSNGTLSINTTNNQAVSFGTGNVVLPYASSTALTVSGSAYLTGLGQGWIHTAGGVNALSASTSPTVNYLTATSTAATSTFPYLSITTNSNLGTVVGGTWQGTAIGAQYGGTGINSSALTGLAQIVSGNWSASSTLSAAFGGTGWGSLQANTLLLGNGSGRLATTSAGTDGYVLGLSAGVPTWLATSTLSTITGTLAVGKGGTGQTSFGQGWLNSNGTDLSASTSPTVNYIVATSTTATSTFPYLSVITNSNLGTVVGGTWQGTAIGDGYLTKSGDWTGTLDTYEASSLLARANHTGTQGVSTLSNYDWTFSNNYGTLNLTGTSTKPIWAQGGLNASSTSNFVYASTTALTISGNSYLGTVSSGAWNGTVVGAQYGGTGINSSALTGIAQIVSGTWSASSTLAVAYGGTGWNNIAAGYIPFGNGASALATSTSFYWDNGNSRLGIGTSTPDSKLTVFASADDSAIEFSSASGSTYKWTMGLDYSDAGKFKIASSTALGSIDRFTIDGNGYVGIGTSTPGRRLDVADSGNNNPQMRLSRESNVYTDFSVAQTTGDLSLALYGTNADDISLLMPDGSTGANLWVCEGSACPSVTLSNGGNIVVERDIKYPTSGRMKRSIILTAAGAIVPAANGAAKTQVDGTNSSYYVLDFDKTADEAAFWQWTIPDSYDSGTIDITYYWTVASATTTTAVWCFQAKGVNTNESVDSSLSSAICETGTAQNTISGLASTTESVAASNFTSGEYVTFKVFRDADHATEDLINEDARLVKVKIEYGVATESD